jgi:hypothetical protein
MKLTLPVVTVTSVAALWLASAGCGSLPHGTATIVGTVTNASTQRYQVKVEGTNVSTTTNSHGQFTLEGVPSGNVTLHFTSNGVDVRLEISGLTEGMTMRITVSINSSGAHMVLGPNDIVLTGTIQSITEPTFTISGLTVITKADTQIKRSGQTLSFADLAVGQLVRVQGFLDAAGNVVASTVQVSVPPEHNQVLIRGIIESITPPDLTVSGLAVTTDANTRFQGHSLAHFNVGDAVEVVGTVTDGTVLASSIKKIRQHHDHDDDQGEDDDDND